MLGLILNEKEEEEDEAVKSHFRARSANHETN